VRGGRKTIEKLEAKVRGLTTDLDCEHRWKTEYMKNFRKAERRLKEIEFQLEEERKSYEKLQVKAKNFQMRVRSLGCLLTPLFCDVTSKFFLFKLVL
jgi:predicted RNase H-like nuclease (RuvC/YqgF family)